MLIDKINKFEALPVQTVGEFNKIFVGNELNFGNVQDEVEIGAIVGPANVRELLVGGVQITHEFNIPKSDSFSIGDFSEWKKPEVKPKRNLGTMFNNFQTNSKLENLILEEREMELEPIEYMLLQYLRGCQSPLHTQAEIAGKVRKSVRTIRDTLKRMQEKRIIKSETLLEIHKMAITVNEEWL